MVLNENQIRKVVAEVVNKYITTESDIQKSLCKNEILLETSARHIHLNEIALKKLFGENAKLTVKKQLSQPGEFLSEQRVKLVTAKGAIDNVAVLGPVRKAVQVELSMTDCRTLGINAPVNLSGDLTGAADVNVITDNGSLFAKSSVIVAKAHIHLTPEDAKNRNLKNGDIVSVKIKSKRPITLDEVIVRVKENFSEALHIDFDEANAGFVDKNTKAEIVQ